MKTEGRKWLFLFVIAAIIFTPFEAKAAVRMEIKSCALASSNKNMVEVSAAGASVVAGTDGKYYLFALMPYEKTVGKESLLVGTAAQKSIVNFRVPLNLNSGSSVLYRKFGIAVKNKSTGKYSLSSNVKYINNAERLAKNKYAFPKAASKKGLQVNTSMLSDAEDLRIRHASVNICINEFVATSSKANSKWSYSCTYQGKRY